MGRGNVWADEEIKTFIGIWGEARIQKELDGAVQNKSVFQSIALPMTEAGFDKDWTQCRAKLKDLKTLYKKQRTATQDRDMVEWFVAFTMSWMLLLVLVIQFLLLKLLKVARTKKTMTAVIQRMNTERQRDFKTNHHLVARTILRVA